MLGRAGGCARGAAQRGVAAGRGAVDGARRRAAREKGITIDGVSYGPIRASFERQQGSNAWIAMALREGKNREVRRVLEHLGLQVTRLIRLSYGPFQLGNLARGAIDEVPKKVLNDQLGNGRPTIAHADRRR